MDLKRNVIKGLVILLALSFFSQISAAEGAGTSGGLKFTRAQYLALSSSEKVALALEVLGLSKTSRYDDFQNLSRTEFFRVSSLRSDAIPDVLLFAAKGALKQYEMDSRENTTMLMTAVVYEPMEQTSFAKENPWLVVIGKSTGTFNGAERIEPVAIYSLERNGAGLYYKSLGFRFGGDLL